MFSAAPFLVTLLDRVKAIVQRVARPAVERAMSSPAGSATGGPVSPVVRGLANGWMSAKLRALSALMRRIEAGERLEPPVRATPLARGEDAPVARAAVPPIERLPRGFGWMCAFGPDVRRSGALFAAWLNEPVMKAMVLAAPERMARVTGPILNATGEPRPEWFPNRAKNSLPPCRGGVWRGVEAAVSCERDSDDQQTCGDATGAPASRGCAPPTTPPTRGGGTSPIWQHRFVWPFERLIDHPPAFCLPVTTTSKLRHGQRRSARAHFVTIS